MKTLTVFCVSLFVSTLSASVTPLRLEANQDCVESLQPFRKSGSQSPEGINHWVQELSSAAQAYIRLIHFGIQSGVLMPSEDPRLMNLMVSKVPYNPFLLTSANPYEVNLYQAVEKKMPFMAQDWRRVTEVLKGIILAEESHETVQEDAIRDSSWVIGVDPNHTINLQNDTARKPHWQMIGSKTTLTSIGRDNVLRVMELNYDEGTLSLFASHSLPQEKVSTLQLFTHWHVVGDRAYIALFYNGARHLTILEMSLSKDFHQAQIADFNSLVLSHRGWNNSPWLDADKKLFFFSNSGGDGQPYRLCTIELDLSKREIMEHCDETIFPKSLSIHKWLKVDGRFFITVGTNNTIFVYEFRVEDRRFIQRDAKVLAAAINWEPSLIEAEGRHFLAVKARASALNEDSLYVFELDVGSGHLNLWDQRAAVDLAQPLHWRRIRKRFFLELIQVENEFSVYEFDIRSKKLKEFAHLKWARGSINSHFPWVEVGSTVIIPVVTAIKKPKRPYHVAVESDHFLYLLKMTLNTGNIDVTEQLQLGCDDASSIFYCTTEGEVQIAMATKTQCLTYKIISQIEGRRP